ncbi:MAG: PEP/pyruvate-binding domain-containing protein [Nanoarchaeota archaeon]|nr:PEP/pyruvate-binding domain-containing protein [Nanoarchaeota archaeon]MBU4352405.1 PEP/pyruvate-binding domain-containing protein [Nanoarchaeota archaeon]MBU4456068.1 PEP/pyruvate-binding domain-containing protein [Nanoarchaeota archaeon]MCG2720301.1 PEP/pyruvate-binding domain-containing protein [Nanoarchaeota archaeon]
MKIAKLKKRKPYLFTDVETWGGKGDNLLKLNEVFNVPQGFVLSADTYTGWINQTGLDRVTNEALKQNPEDAYKIIRGNYQNTSFSQDLVSRLNQEFDKLQHPLAVRSSSIDEDGSNNSFAGQHESILGVTNFEEFLIAIKEVYASLFTPRAIQYRQNQQLGKRDAIAVVVQEMIDPIVSGVAYSPSPNNINEILIESTWGLCTSIVDGRPCDIYRIADSITGNIIPDISPKKLEMDKFDVKSKRVKTKKVPFLDRKASSLSKPKVFEVAETIKSIERAYGMPMDMEFAYDKDSTLYVLQARPLTGIVQNEVNVELPNLPNNRILARSKNTRNQGIFEGPVVVVRGVDHVNRSFDIDGDLIELNKEYQDGYILLTPEVPPQLEQFVTNARAMYATECGTTGHAAAIAVEKGIIYLGRGNSNVPNLLQSVRSGMRIGIAVSKDEGLLYIPEDAK